MYQSSSIQNYLTSNGLNDCILETIENQNRFNDNPFPILSNNCIRVGKRILFMIYWVSDILHHLITYVVEIIFMLILCWFGFEACYKMGIRATIWYYQTFAIESIPLYNCNIIIFLNSQKHCKFGMLNFLRCHLQKISY